MEFYVGLHQPSDAHRFDRCCISINRIRTRRSGFAVNRWMMDSGAFTELAAHGHYRTTPQQYATEAARWIGNGNLEAVVTQDFMCEPFMLQRTGLTIADHQRLTIERYDELVACDLAVYVLPVLQGYSPSDYVRHLDQYGDRLQSGAWVGVGSVCKRNIHPESVASVLLTIKRHRPDLRLHGFGVKSSALTSGTVRELLYSADSMAWSYAARMQGRDGNCWTEAEQFRKSIDRPRPVWFQDSLEGID